jgi:hypothetical protein
MKDNAGCIYYRTQIGSQTIPEVFDQNQFQLLRVDFRYNIKVSGTDCLPNPLKQLLDFGYNKFASSSGHPFSNRRAQQQLVHRRYFSQNALQIGFGHLGISAQQEKAVNSSLHPEPSRAK